MNPIFRTLTIWSHRTDEAIYRTLLRGGTSDWFVGFFVEFILLFVSAGFLYARLFERGTKTMTRKDVVLVIAAVVVFFLCCRALLIRACRRLRFAKAREASRKAKASAAEQVWATMFFSDHLMHYGMAAGKSTKLNYEQIHEIRYSREYIFLITANTDLSPICLEKAGFVGITWQDALRWLGKRCNCRPRR